MRIFFILLMIGLFAGASIVIAAENLLENPSFEEPLPDGNTDETPMRWWSWNSDYNGTTAKVSKTGKYSVYFSTPAENAEQIQGMAFTFKDVKPNKGYTFSIYVLGSKENPIKGDAYGQISIEWRKSGKEINRSWGPTWGTDLSFKKWESFSITAVAPEGVDECFFVITFFTKGGSGTFYVDDAMAFEK